MENSSLISCPFAEISERRNSRRYHWQNDTRGDDSFVILQWTISGEGAFTWKQQTWPVPPDHILIALPPEVSSYGYPADGREPWHFSWINWYGSLALRLLRDFRDQFGPVLPLKRESREGIAFAQLIRTAASRKNQDAYQMSADCYQFLMDWSRLLQSPNRQLNPVAIAKRICETRFQEPIGIKELAAQAGLTREHFTRIFTHETGVPPAHYLRKIRVRTARKMLKFSPRNEVALRCGFPSVRALNRALATRSPGRLDEPPGD